MNDRLFNRKVEQDAAKIKKDVSNLVETGTDQVEAKVGKFTDDVKETLDSTTATAKKDVEQKLREYNAKAQEYVEKVPGGLAEKVAKYPWVAISIGLGVGILMGGLFKPSRR